MNVRVAGPDDLAQVLALDRAAEGAAHWLEAEYAAAINTQATPPRIIFVTQEDEHLIGFACVKFVAGIAEIENISVDAQVRRQGIGRALVDAAAAWSSDLGAQSLQLEVRAGNTSALGLYAAMGFVIAGRRAAYYSSPAEDAVLLDLAIGQ
jgi:ribosomal-protein-alanine acetyltransferase